MKLRIQLAGMIALAAAVPSFAQIKINDNLTVTGWATGSYQYTKPTPGKAVDSLNVDGGLLEAIVTPAKKTTVYASMFYRPSAEGGVSPSGSEVTLLDAYVTYAASDTVTLKFGKFLSNLGYESFYFNQDNMISLANQQLLAPIPGYHTGVEVDFAPDKADSMGIQVADSEYQKPGYAATEGDGEFQHNGGAEVFYKYTGVTGLTLWAGAGYESKTQPGYDTNGVTAEFTPKGAQIQGGHDVLVYDVWATYTVDKNNDQIAVEEIYKDGGFANKGSNWLAYFQYNFAPKVYSWFCVSGEDVTKGASYVKYSVAPTYVYNANLSVRAQYSYTNYNKFGITSANYFGAEVIFQF